MSDVWKQGRRDRDYYETERIGPASLNLFLNLDGVWVARLWIVSSWDEGDGESHRIEDWHLGMGSELTADEAKREALMIACRWFGEAAVEIDKHLQRTPVRGEGDEG